MYRDKIAAGIVTYNPDINRLMKNLSAVIEQVGIVFIFDNGSKNIDEIEKAVFSSAILIKSQKNKGIAYALNRLFEKSAAEGYDWLLTLDQDSVCMPDLINNYRRFLSEADSITSLRYDVNYPTGDIEGLFEYRVVDRCITSGNLVRISTWRRINGFNERLFIDMVDEDFSYRLRLSGGRIIQLGIIGFQHELGDGSRWFIFGKNVFIGNYSEFRKYYIARNMVYFIRKYHPKGNNYSYLKLIVLFLHTLLKEPNKWARCKALICGSVDGFRCYKYIDSYWTEKSNI